MSLGPRSPARDHARADSAAPTSVTRSRRPATASPRFAPAHKPDWSTTSTTASPGTSSPVPRRPRRTLGDIGLVAALYPGVWSVAQIATGHWLDRVGRKPLITAGMLVQAPALGLLALSDGALGAAAAAAVVLGADTALVYPTLIAAMSDAVTPVARAPVVGSTASGATADTSSAA
jgi:MFS family permease